ncbi:putative anti-sigma factor antagonist BtrV [Sporotomaculum syntrophicum]|uniref:Anti-sigma factor antagonist BtrV n=1 Tax=Sporotomaculum syntrophicum TaxID=182264 RepID=A0A9D2WRF5_9FIRM|nr:STAS domain-containing protein [Sporotomaculum syntrophicum]KAF1086205.1 putative anti-sigma factor antagonist BtrV [Sporotomaculum syntrophicum]
MLEVSIFIEEGILQICLQGRFDGLGAQLFEQKLKEGIKNENQWIIDFTNVTYLSSAGIRSLIKCGKKLAKLDGRLILMGLTRDVKSVLQTTGVLQLFGQAEGMAEAMKQINMRLLSERPNSFAALGRVCTWQILSAKESCLDIWNPLKKPSRNNLDSINLLPASLEDLGVAFGIGGLGFDRVDAFEGLGPFLALERMIGVMPADGYNQPDFMVVNDPREAETYIAAAASFSGQPWGRLDIPPGAPVNLQDIHKLIIEKLQEKPHQNKDLLGMVIVGRTQTVNGSYYQNREDLKNNHLHNREVSGNKTILLIGMAASAAWKTDEYLAPLMAQQGIKPGEEFFWGNVLVFANIIDWQNIQEPGEVLKYCSDLELMQDVCIADKNMTLTEGRVWFFIPGQIRSGEEKQLQIEVGDGIAFPEEWGIITRRLYSDARRVVLEPLHGGFSLGKPFRVTAYDNANRRMLPTVLKIGPTSLIEKEIENHQKYVHGYILNNSTTIMGQTTCGDTTGMRYNFLGISGPDSNLCWLTNRFQEKPVGELIPLFDEIFTHILKPWYGQPCWEMIKPYQEHNPLVRFPMILEEAEKELGISAHQDMIDCPELGVVLPNPYNFLQKEYPARQSASRLWYTGINHGDLNMQNILLDERDNVYIIDFSDTGPRNIVSDFARLEPIFKFEMTRLGNNEDLISFLEFERALAQVNSLDEMPPFVYRGNDPEVVKVYHMICQIRKYAKTVVIFETDIIPYLLAMLEWTFPVVIYGSVTPLVKKAATYSAALIVEQIMRLDRI